MLQGLAKCFVKSEVWRMLAIANVEFYTYENATRTNCTLL